MFLFIGESELFQPFDTIYMKHIYFVLKAHNEFVVKDKMAELNKDPLTSISTKIDVKYKIYTESEKETKSNNFLYTLTYRKRYTFVVVATSSDECLNLIDKWYRKSEGKKFLRENAIFESTERLASSYKMRVLSTENELKIKTVKCNYKRKIVEVYQEESTDEGNVDIAIIDLSMRKDTVSL
jgi:hypothetical protein